MYATWTTGKPLSIRFVGNNINFKRFIENLVDDFNEPKFGYNGELWDEDDNCICDND